MTEIKLDRKLNVVVPVETDKGTVHVHSTPVSRDVFEKYAPIIGKTFSQLYGGGYILHVMPRVAYLILKGLAEKEGVWEGDQGVKLGLIEEIRRLTNVTVLLETGWRSIPYFEAVRHGYLTAEDAAEVDNILVFFTAASVVHTKKELHLVLPGASLTWGGSTTYLDCTAFAASLPISTPEENTGEKVILSSIPS